MLPKFPAVYVYNTKTNTVDQYFNMTKDVINFTNSSDRHTYACDFLKKIRIEVDPAYEKVFHVHGSYTYSLCLSEQNYEKAVELLTDYILTRLHEKADYHQQKTNEYTNMYVEVQNFRNDILSS